MSKLFPRHIKPLLLEALKDSPAVLIHGPRQCGKTTLARMVEKTKKYTYISFDDDVVVSAAKIDPIGFVNSLPNKVILDEIQKAPYLFSALKTVIDNNKTSGRFILTGSANILHLPKLSDSLAGRMHILRLHPLSQRELKQSKPNFLNTLFQCQFTTKNMKTQPHQLIERIIAGGYPAVFTRPIGRRRANWYRNYVETVIKRDILDISKARSIDILPKLLNISASQTAQLINFTHLANAFQVSRTTICDYVSLLEQMFFLEKLPPWHNNHLKRLIKTPKLHFCDTGLASAILGYSEQSLKSNHPLLGQLVETFVFQELKRQASCHKEHHSFFHYRDKKGVEVDIIIEKAHLVSGLEVKSSSTVRISDFKGLYKMKEVLKKRFVCGVVFYNGKMSVCFDKDMYAIPLSVLWF